MSLVVRGRILLDGKLQETGLRVEDGTVQAISSNDLGHADQVLTLGPRQVLVPAAIDMLCAMRDWAEAPRETVETATMAALAGGNSIVCDQANTVPRLNSSDLVQRRSDWIAKHSFSDFGVSGHPPVDPDDLRNYRAAGAFSVQLFPWDLQPWSMPRDVDISGSQFSRFREEGLSALFMPDELAFRETALRDVGETYALRALLRRIDPALKARIAVTLPSSVEMILKERERLPNLLIQTAAYALFMSREAGFDRIGSAAFVVPPLRPEPEVAQMRRYAEEGKIDIVVSGHCPHRTGDKYSSEPIEGEFTPKSGFSMIDTAFSLTLSRLGPIQACRVFCEMPAKFLGLKKGKIEKGFDADFVVMDEESGVIDKGIHESGEITPNVWKVDPSDFRSKGKVTPFVGERVKFRVAKTFLRGQQVYDAASGTFTRVKVQRVG